MSSSITDAAMAALQPRLGRYPPLHVIQNGRTPIGHTQTEVFRDVVIPIKFDQDGTGNGYQNGATHWMDFVHSVPYDAYIWFMQLMLAMCDNLDKIGGSICHVVPEDNPKLYHKILNIAAKRFCAPKKVTKEDMILFNRYVSCGAFYDPGYAQDLTDTINNMGLKKKPAPKASASSKKKQAAVVQKSFSEFVASKNMVMEKMPLYNDARLEIDENFFVSRNLDGEWQAHLEAQQRLAEELLRGPAPQQPEKEEPAAPAAVDLQPYYGDRRLEKVTFTMVPIPSSDGQVKGFLARFVIRDPSVNPGVFFNMVLENVQTRRSPASTKRSFGGSVELFPHYGPVYNTGHPLGNYCSVELYAQQALKVNPDLTHSFNNAADLRRRLDYMGDTTTSIFQLFPIERALRVFGMEDSVFDWLDGRNKVAKFPLEGFRYDTKQVFWVHQHELGLMEQYFPFANHKSNLIAKLCTGKYTLDNLLSSEETLAGDVNEEDLSVVFTRAEHILMDNVRVNKDLLAKTNQLGYEINDDFVHEADAADRIFAKAMRLLPCRQFDTLVEVQALVKRHGKHRWRNYAKEELVERFEEGERFNELLQKVYAERMTVFCSKWQWKGDVDRAAVSEPIKFLLKWFRDNESSLPNVSRPFIRWDPELCAFGNTQIQQMDIFVKFARVLQPMICMLSEGMFSCYEHMMRELTFNPIIHGRFDVGKTFAAILTLIKFSTIENTVAEFNLQTKAADVTRFHERDWMRAADECPRWITSKREAEKNPDLVDKEKIKMTRNQLAQKTFCYVKKPGTEEQVRWNEMIITDSKVATVYVTNAKVEDKEALSSRMMRITAKQSDTPASEMIGKMDAFTKANTRRWLHLNQYLSCCLKKAGAVGCITREPEMTLFLQIANRVQHYLREWGHLADDVGSRSLEIMLPYARQLVDKMAIRMYYDMPWSPGFQKPFHPSQMQHVQRYRYSTTSITWWTLTACASEWINDDNANVLRGLIIESGFDWGACGENAYDVFATDIAHKVPFRRSPNTEFQKRVAVVSNGDQQDGGDMGAYDKNDEWLVNLNYLCVTGSLEQISARVAQHTKPRMSPTDVQSTIECLRNNLVKVDRNGYAPQPLGSFSRWHKFKVLPDSAKGIDGEKQRGPGCPDRWMRSDERGAQNPTNVIRVDRTEDDVAPLSVDSTKIPVVDLTEIRQNRLFFNPNAIGVFNQAVLERALVAAICCDTTRRGKYLQGFSDPADATRNTICTLSEETIREAINKIDSFSGYMENSNGSVTYTGDVADEEMRPISRRVGVSFNNRGGLHREEGDAIAATQWAPSEPGDESWKEGQLNGVKLMSKTREVVPDLDLYSASLQHVACGLPMDEPVHDTAFIENAYDEWCRRNHKAPDLGKDYPFDNARVKNRLNETWHEMGVASKIRDGMESIFTNRTSKDSKRSRAERNGLQNPGPAQRIRMSSSTSAVEGPVVGNANAMAAMQAMQRQLGQSAE